jgi:hypothetical protein
VKKILDGILLLAILCISLVTVIYRPQNARSSQSIGTSWLTGWTYRKSHTIDSAVGAGVNYTLPITVVNGTGIDSGDTVYAYDKTKSDFSDVRFTGNDGSTLLYYWNQTVNVGANATFWFKNTDNLTSANSTIYIYYGNLNVSWDSTYCKASQVFLFYDDFEENNMNKWTVSNGWTTTSAEAAQGTYSATSTTARALFKNITLTSSFMIHEWFYATNTATYCVYPAYETAEMSTQVYACAANSNNFGFYQGSYASWPSNSAWSPNSWYELTFGFTLGTGGIIDATENGTSMGEISDKDENGNWVYNVTQIGVSGSNGDSANYLDQFYVRNWVKPEPAQGVWGPEEISHTSVQVDPSLILTSAGQSFNVSIAIFNVTDLYMWVLSISWNPVVLDFVNITEGEFLKRGGVTSGILIGEINQAGGYLKGASSSLTGSVPGVDGDGCLATLSFRVNESCAAGSSFLNIYSCDLVDSNGSSIPCGVVNGVVNVGVDLSIVSVDIPQTTLPGCGNFTIPLNLTILETGTVGVGAFNVSFAAFWVEGGLTEEFEKVRIDSLAANTKKTLSFRFTTNHAGNYTFTFIVDCDNDIAEYNRANNRLSLTRAFLVPNYVLPSQSYSAKGFGQSCVFSCEWINGTNPISWVGYSTNVSGFWTWNNTATLTQIDSTHFWANFTATLPITAGVVVEYFWIANDTSNNWDTDMPNQTLIITPIMTINTLGTTTSTGYPVAGSLNAPLFDGCIVFWRNTPSGFNLTAFNLTSKVFSDVWTSQNNEAVPSGSSPCCTATTVVGNTLYAGYSWENSGAPYFTSRVIYTTDPINFKILGNVNLSLESICNYTGGGTYNNTLYFGGTQSEGAGTYAAIDRWYSGVDQSAWSGTVDGSDDCCFLTMFNSTCMIGSDACPNNIIYTNDGVSFTDEYTGSTYTSTYPFVWAWSVYVTSGTAYIAARSSSSPTTVGGSGNGATGPPYGGMATWTGAGTYTPTSWNPVNLYTVSNGLVGGSDGLINSSGWTGSPAIYTYNSTGGLIDEIWHNSSALGAVLSLVYDNGVWYGLYYDALSQNVTIISINTMCAVGGGGSRMSPYAD